MLTEGKIRPNHWFAWKVVLGKVFDGQFNKSRYIWQLFFLISLVIYGHIGVCVCVCAHCMEKNKPAP